MVNEIVARTFCLSFFILNDILHFIANFTRQFIKLVIRLLLLFQNIFQLFTVGLKLIFYSLKNLVRFFLGLLKLIKRRNSKSHGEVLRFKSNPSARQRRKFVQLQKQINRTSKFSNTIGIWTVFVKLAGNLINRIGIERLPTNTILNLTKPRARSRIILLVAGNVRSFISGIPSIMESKTGSILSIIRNIIKIQTPGKRVQLNSILMIIDIRTFYQFTLEIQPTVRKSLCRIAGSKILPDPILLTSRNCNSHEVIVTVNLNVRDIVLIINPGSADSKNSRADQNQTKNRCKKRTQQNKNFVAFKTGLCYNNGSQGVLGCFWLNSSKISLIYIDCHTITNIRLNIILYYCVSVMYSAIVINLFH